MNDAQWKIADAAVKKMEREGTSKAGKAITAELFWTIAAKVRLNLMLA